MIEQCMENLRNRLNEACRKDGVAQARISRKCGVSTRELRRIMSGQVKDIRVSTLIDASEALGVLVEELTVATGTKAIVSDWRKTNC